MGDIMLYRRSIAAMALAAAMTIAGMPASGTDMKYPAWDGQWRNPTANRGGNPWDPSKPMGRGQEAPLTPEYQAIFEAGLKSLENGGQGNSRGTRCELPGMPKVMNFSQVMEIVIRPSITYFVPLHYPTRRIHTDGRDWPKDEPPSFSGYSIGKWIDEDGDGRYDVLQVETRNFVGPRVFESSGIPLHKDNQTIVQERIYLDKDNPDLLHNVITTIDNALTRPWTVHRIQFRQQNPLWPEYNCREGNNHVTIGTEEYFLSADGKLMPVRKDQPPPDLSYFKQSQ
jgi:hypothetical protein